MNKNIFKLRDEAEQNIRSTAEHFVAKAVNLLQLHTDGKFCTALLPSWMTSRYPGYSIEAYYHEVVTYPPNPDYDPSAPHTPENIAKSTGFNWIEKREPMVNIVCTETPDEDDYSGDETERFSFNNIPFDLFVNQDEDQMKSLFVNKNKETIEREKRQHLHNKWIPLIEYTPDELRRFADKLERPQTARWWSEHVAEIVDEMVNEDAN